jgi:hypothetical protein
MIYPQINRRILVTLAVLGLVVLQPVATHAQTLHYYDLTQGYSDAYGGPALTPNAGATRTSAGYSFGVDQGPNLTGGLSSLSSYSIEMVFSLAANNGSRGNGYQKLIDFKALGSDAGLYDLNGTLDFYSDADGTTTVFTPGQTADIMLTRNGTTNVVTGYAGGVQQFQFTDTNGDAVFASNSILFFQDDNNTGNQEAGSGLLKTISINGGVAAPEPSQSAALGLGLLGLSGLVLCARRHRISA